ncbi:hypothetical protein [Comamonas terrigena]|uniref:hypothetical protein n=1 Tax=Comamonas terrigena TaxID=32013 RepID=UPI00289B5575|nr:hypothetical protein [Comamonas terrigena]
MMQVFAIVGESLQQVGGDCPEGWVVMNDHRPDVDSIARADGTWGPGVLPVAWPRFVGNQKLDLFTSAEQLEVVTATMQDPVVKLLYDRLLGAAYWSYEDSETEQGLALLVGKGLLTPERKAEIVAAMQPQ